MSWILPFALILAIALVDCSLPCSKYEFPCENGECVDAGLWCDTHEDCADGSDEKYCKKAGFLNTNPNKCPSTYFKCKDGPCIPAIGRCDSYDNCADSSDEKDCVDKIESSSDENTTPHMRTVTSVAETNSTTSTASAPLTTTYHTLVQVDYSNETRLSDSPAEPQHQIQFVSSKFKPSDFSHQREMARSWLLSQRRADFGWGDETPRALTALYLSDVQASKRNESDMLMVKQLEVQLSLDMARNGSKTVKLTDLALYINALMASCRDPKNFYGEDLIQILRSRVDNAQRQGAFVNPSVYLSLCLSNVTTYEDTRKLHGMFLSRNITVNRIDIQALLLLTSTCMLTKTNHLASSVYEGFRNQFINRMNVGAFPENVYEAALLQHALREIKGTRPGLFEFILKQQQEDGSFGGVLATYLVLPLLGGRSFIQMKDHCAQEYTTDLEPLEVLKNTKRRKIHVQYSLNYGYPAEVTQTIQMQVAEGINFLDVMRLAQDINPKYRFMLDGNRDIPVVYSIGGIPNDAEKGMFWTLHFASSRNRVSSDLDRLIPFSGNIKMLIPQTNDEFIFWMRSI